MTDILDRLRSPSASELYDMLTNLSSTLHAAADEIESLRSPVYIIFDGPPGHDMPRFVEIENADGHSVKAGEWLQRPDGFWALRFPG